MRHIAIIGSGPAGYYTAEAAQKLWGEDVRVDIFDMLPVPYGLIRTGVAPDHQSIKAVYRRYEATSLSENVRFVGNVMVGKDISIAELQDLYDAVVLATGAPHDKKVGLPGEDLGNVFGSAAFVGWYNGHPDFADLGPDFSGKNAVVIGNGNVALDVARILAKTRDGICRQRHCRPCARCAGSGEDRADHHPRPPRPASDRHDAQGTGRAGPSRTRLPAASIPPICPRKARTRCSSRASASRSPICAASPRFRRSTARTRRSTWSSISSPRPRRFSVRTG